MISEEELQLIQSFKHQIDEKINIFHERHTAVLQQEQDLRILKQKTEDAELEFDKLADEYKKTLSMLRTQIKFEREMNRIVKLVGRYLISIEKCCINIFCSH